MSTKRPLTVNIKWEVQTREKQNNPTTPRKIDSKIDIKYMKTNDVIQISQ